MNRNLVFALVIVFVMATAQWRRRHRSSGSRFYDSFS